MKISIFVFVFTIILTFQYCAVIAKSRSPIFELSYSPLLEEPEPITGRIFVVISTNASVEDEPRFQMRWQLDTQQLFGTDVNDLRAEELVFVDENVLGYPAHSLSDIPLGRTYWVQGVLQRYRPYNPIHGHTLMLLEQEVNEGGFFDAPGVLYSEPEPVTLTNSSVIRLHLTHREGPRPAESEDTEYLKRDKIRSALLSEFWGEDVYLGSTCLLPHGFNEHPDARYPLFIYHGHYQREFAIPSGFREDPPDDPDDLLQEYSHYLYRNWTSETPGSPFYLNRGIIVTIQHANPFYDDSYAVNSANVGPYGDAITYELIPFLEEKYRGIGEPWSRVMYGGSTGGWESFVAQVFYPDFYNGAWAFCPDQLDYRAYCANNIYDDENAYYYDSDWKKLARPGVRDYTGNLQATIEEMNIYELVKGDKSRSADQYDIWEAVMGPLGDDGYPKRLFDKRTGEIDHEVARHFQEYYDPSYILQRDWEDGLGELLYNKLNIYTGQADTFYLTHAVYLLEDFLRSTNTTSEWKWEGVIEYGSQNGRGFEHCWTGDFENPISISRLTTAQRFVPLFVEHMVKTAPPGSDISSWRY